MERIETHPYRDFVVVKAFRSSDDTEPELELEVHFSTGKGVPLAAKMVRVQSTGAALTASYLQRLAWGQYLELADAAIRFHYTRTMEDAKKQTTRLNTAARGLLGDVEKPGRKPLPDEHYRRIANRVLELRSQGVGQPVAAIAAEEQQNRNTVAGWVKKARERRLLTTWAPWARWVRKDEDEVQPSSEDRAGASSIALPTRAPVVRSRSGKVASPPRRRRKTR